MNNHLSKLMNNVFGIPETYAVLEGSSLAPHIEGSVYFYPSGNGSIVIVELEGLPEHIPAILDREPIGPFGFHIHEGNNCTNNNGENAFENAGGHYNPNNTHHPQHAGDLPVIFSNDGYAWMAVYTNRFSPSDVIGRSVILHRNPDDFRTQPSGNSGVRIACGIIKKYR